jgi:hypothetical protein
MKCQATDTAYFTYYRKVRKLVPRDPAKGDVMKWCQMVFWVQVYAEKNSQNVKMEQIAAGSQWDRNDDVMKTYK